MYRNIPYRTILKLKNVKYGCIKQLSPLIIKRNKVDTKVDFSSPMFVKHLDSIKKRFDVITNELMNTSNSKDLSKLGRELSSLTKTIEIIKEREEHLSSLNDLNQMINEEDDKNNNNENDEDLLKMIEDEKLLLNESLKISEEKLVKALTPIDDADHRNAVLEVRSGTGGDEASLFAAEIFKMYQKYALAMGWRWEELDVSWSDAGGFKGAQALVSGESIFEKLKFENGVHRVQRVPSNDVRIHTSAASVVILPEAEEVDVDLKPSDLKVEVMRAQGAGGQSVNKIESAVRMTHIPTGCTVSMQDERCQQQNRIKALKVLRARVYDVERQKKEEERSKLVESANGTGARGDKIRTYNFPQDRITDHRIQMSLNGVERFFNDPGDKLQEFIDVLAEGERSKRLEHLLIELANDNDDSTSSDIKKRKGGSKKVA